MVITNKEIKKVYENTINKIFNSNLNEMSLDLLIGYLKFFSLFHNKTKKDKEIIKLLSIEINKKWAGAYNE